MELNRNQLVEHAEIILKSNRKGAELAKEMDMNTRQFYNYRNGSMDISKARLETLLKFEALYKCQFEVDGNTKQ